MENLQPPSGKNLKIASPSCIYSTQNAKGEKIKQGVFTSV